MSTIAEAALAALAVLISVPSLSGQAPATSQAPVATQAAGDPAPRVGAEALSPLSRGEDAVVVTIGDEDLRRSDVFRVLDLAVPARSYEVIRQMVLSTAARRDAQREGIDVDAATLEDQTRRAIAENKASFALEVDSDLPLEDYLLQRHGMTPEQFHGEIRHSVLSSLLIERAVRLDQLRMDRDEIAIIVVSDGDLADEIAGKLREGASFSVLAKRHSVHPSAGAGGDVGPVPAGMDTPLFAGREDLQPGGLLGPKRITLGEKTYWRILRLIDRASADETPWSGLRDRVEAGLASRPITPDELSLFEARAIDRYRVTRPQ